MLRQVSITYLSLTFFCCCQREGDKNGENYSRTDIVMLQKHLNKIKEARWQTVVEINN